MFRPLKRAFQGHPLASDLVTVLALGGFALFFGLGNAKLWDRDEPRNARCAKEMMDRSDWVVPTFNGKLRTHKPVLTYWIMIGSYTLFGVNEFAARFGSAMLGVGTLLCTYLMGRRLAGREVGLIASLLLACAIMFQVASRAATPDGPLIFCVTAALTAFVLAATKPAAEDDGGATFAMPSRWQMGVVYLVLGLAVLAKGPVGIVLPGCTMLAFLTLAPWLENESIRFNRRSLESGFVHFLRAEIGMRPLMGLALVSLVAAPWYVAVGMATDGEFLRGFFLEHNLRRATETMEGHRGNVFFYPLTILAGFFPGSIFMLPTLIESIRDLRRRARYTTAILFCGLWIGAFVGAFSLAGTKLPSYVTPCYPAVAIAVAITVARWIAGKEKTHVWGVVAGVVLLAVGAIGMVVLGRELHQRLPEKLYLVVALSPLVIGGIVATIMSAMQNHRSAFGATIAAGITLAVGVWGWGAGELNDARSVASVLGPIAGDASRKSTLAVRCLEASYVFYSDREFVEIGDLNMEPAAKAALEAAEFDRVLARASDVASFPPSFQRNYQEVAQTGVFLKEDRLVLFERIESVARNPVQTVPK